MKVAVVGAGSTYTPELVEGFAGRPGGPHVDDLALVDVDAERLEVVGGLAGRILEARGWPGTLTLTTRRQEALEGAQFVVVQLRVGGQAARLRDETLPLEFGCIGQETTGAGGFAKALRTVPIVLEIAEEVAERGEPGAWLLDFTNPVGVVTQALLDGGHRAIGLCNVAITLQRRLAALFEVEPDRVELDHVGLNHLTWERRVLVDGVDRLPELIEERADWIAKEVGLPIELVRALGMIPSYYLRYYYATDRVLEEQRGGHLRAREVMEIERSLLRMYRDPQLTRKPPLLEQRGGAFYSEAAAQLMASLVSGAGDVQVVDVRNDGAVPGLPTEAVVEVSARIGPEGPVPIPGPPLPPDVLGLVQHVKGYERLTAEAARTGDRGVALRALVANPLVADHDRAVGLLDRILEQDRELPPPGR